MIALFKNLTPLILIAGLTTCTGYQCNQFDWDGGTIKLVTVNDHIHYIVNEKDGEEISRWELPYPVYQFDYGDVNGDSIPEIAVGVIKGSRHFPIKNKRLFIFKLFDKKLIRPLWLGSHLSGELIDFKIERDTFPAGIHTLEMRKDSTKYEMHYHIEGFGPYFDGYINKNSELKKL